MARNWHPVLLKAIFKRYNPVKKGSYSVSIDVRVTLVCGVGRTSVWWRVLPLYLFLHVYFAAISLQDINIKHASLQCWILLFKSSPSADTYWFNVWCNVRLNAHKWVCERVNVCTRLCFWTCCLVFTCISAYVYFPDRVCWWVGVCVPVCTALSVCLRVCMCFAHSQPIFIRAVIATVLPSLSWKVHARPREACWQLILFWEFCLFQTCSVVR